ncbi:MAG: F0F1 ATP synthase subunit A [Bacteroidota bacterium]
MRLFLLTFCCFLGLSNFSFAGSGSSGDDHSHDDGHGHGFNPQSTAFHHIADANVYGIGPINIPLPCILYSKDDGLAMFSSGKFDIIPHNGPRETEGWAHGDGHAAYQKYVLNSGMVMRVVDPSFPAEKVKIDGFIHKKEGKKHKYYTVYQGKEYELEKSTTADFGVFGGGFTSFYDFSLTKNATSMLLICLLMGWFFISMARSYKNNEGRAPTGANNLMESIFVFIQDEVAKPFLGHKWEQFLPFLMSLFFFILGLNLFGQIPFLGGSNVTGNLAVTAVLAIFTFLMTNFNGNKHYWEHTLWMPGVPAWLKLFILTPVEVLGLFIKPVTLMLRLFANITAGHMVLVIFTGLIFLFGKENLGASIGSAIPAGILTLFMMSIELLVAFIQAFVFTILTASYLGMATEEAHH